MKTVYIQGARHDDLIYRDDKMIPAAISPVTSFVWWEHQFSSIQYSALNYSHHARTLDPQTSLSYITASLYPVTNISPLPPPPLSLYSFAFINWKD